MIYFMVPLRSRASSNNWESVSRHFNCTLRSLFRQTSENFRVFVACHDKPVLEQDYDERLEFFFSQRPSPERGAVNAQMEDKSFKLAALLREIALRGGGYAMVVDADDLVSRRLVEYHDSHTNPHGLVVHFGYEFNLSTGRLGFNPYIHRYCGSSHILKIGPEDWPEGIEQKDWQIFSKKNFDEHRTVYSNYKRAGKPLGIVPFCGVVYVTQHENSWSCLEATQRGVAKPLRSYLLRLMPKFRPRAAQVAEFGLDGLLGA